MFLKMSFPNKKAILINIVWNEHPTGYDMTSHAVAILAFSGPPMPVYF